MATYTATTRRCDIGRLKKPAGTAAGPQNGAVLVPAGKLEVDFRTVPRPPAGVRKQVRDLWRDYWHDPISKTYSPADIGVLTRWAQAWERYFEALENFEAEPIVTGSMGQLVLSPWHTVLNSAITAIEKTEANLGLSPLSRARLGVTLGEARKSLDDHAAEASGKRAVRAPVVVTQVIEAELEEDPDDPRLG